MPYASSLESLTVNISEQGIVLTNDWNLTKAYSNLKAIELFSEYGSYQTIDCPLDLRHLTALTRLVVADDRVTMVAETLHCLTNVRCLILKDEPGYADPSAYVSNMPHLTHLTLVDLCSWPSPSCQTGLKELVVLSQKSLIDWKHILLSMPGLESLYLGSFVDTQFQSTFVFLSRLANLKTIRLRNVLLDESFFFSIRSLHHLTCLELIRCVGIDHGSLSDVNGLTSLQSLWLHQSEALDPCSYIQEGKLIRLRKLSLPAYELSPEIRKELFARLPSLRYLESVKDLSTEDTEDEDQPVEDEVNAVEAL